MLNANEACTLSDSQFKWLEYEDSILGKIHLAITEQCREGKWRLNFKIEPCHDFPKLMETISRILKEDYGYAVLCGDKKDNNGRLTISIFWDEGTRMKQAEGKGF